MHLIAKCFCYKFERYLITPITYLCRNQKHSARIFLDEPLSGFDVQRREGFMHLLQEELPKYFDQIIVISHLEQMRDEFPYHIQLEAGQVVK